MAFLAAAALGRVSPFAPSTTAVRQTIIRSASTASSPLGMSSGDTITLGIFGGGTVGGGIVEILSNKADYFKQLTGKNIEVKKVTWFGCISNTNFFHFNVFTGKLLEVVCLI